MQTKKLFFYLKIIVSMGLLSWIFTHVSLKEWMIQMSHVPTYLLLIMVSMILLQVVGQGIRWSLILRTFDCQVTAKKTILINMLSLLCNQTLPSTIGGDIVRMSQIRKDVPDAIITIQSVVMDRFLGFVSLVLLMGGVLPLWWNQLGAHPAVYGLMILLIGGLLVSVLLLFIPIAILKYKKLANYSWLVVWGMAMKALLSKPALFFMVMVLSVCLQLINVWVMYLLFGVVQSSVGFIDCLLVIPAVTLLSMVPVSIGGWGVRESFMLTGFSLLGVSATSSVSVSLLFGVVLALAGLTGGIIWFVARRRYHRASSIK